MVNAQSYIEKKYPIKEERKEIVRLDIWNKNLEGSLDLSDFVNLEELECGINKLTFCRVSNCPKLREIYCFDNQLTSLEINNLDNIEELNCRDNSLTDLNSLLVGLNSKKLKELYLFGNNFSSDLTPFS